ncbi:SH3-domain-containing protein [Auricularia subglabra TFB-10046 SS5]|nr:SH3-domain-containing protein [Auricularia subglabra TFB-10046 SS5]
MTAQDPYVAHVVSRIEADVAFLVAQNELSADAARAITSQLPSAAPTMPTPAATSPPAFVGALRRNNVPPPPIAAPSEPEPVMLKALWDWSDEDGNDLSFKSGDLIELVEETNNDWWTGRMGARTGLFPSNYVEKVASTSHRAAPRAPVHVAASSTYKASNLNQYHAPPPPSEKNGQHDPNAQGPPATNAIGLTAPAVDEKKKGKFGGYGKTMAHSAAGGVGFGAGAAIGGGLVRAIF